MSDEFVEARGIYPRLSDLFNWAWQRHLDKRHFCGEYEVCGNPVCWVAWFLEKWLWYGGMRDE